MSKVMYKLNQLKGMSIQGMSPILSVISIEIISKVVISKVIISIVVVSTLRLALSDASILV